MHVSFYQFYNKIYQGTSGWHKLGNGREPSSNPAKVRAPVTQVSLPSKKQTDRKTDKYFSTSPLWSRRELPSGEAPKVSSSASIRHAHFSGMEGVPDMGSGDLLGVRGHRGALEARFS